MKKKKKPTELPPGYITSAQAREILGNQMLYRYVDQGLINRYGPEFSKQKYYKREEVLALKAAKDAFFHPVRMEEAQFGVAGPEDLDAIIAMDYDSFGLPFEGQTYKRWYWKNPEAFLVLRTTEGNVKGYAILLPIKARPLEWFIANKISMDEIMPEDIELFEAGKPLHLYIIAMAIDPLSTGAVKRGYGARLLKGIFTTLMELARAGVEIETVTARSFTFDGIKLLMDLGLPYIRAESRGMMLFSLRIAESEYPLFVAYRELLREARK